MNLKLIEHNSFTYICIIIFSTFFISSINIPFQSLIGLIVGLIICYLINNNELIKNNKINEILKDSNVKTKYIRQFQIFQNFIQEIDIFKKYNYDAYIEIIDNINAFLDIYTDIKST